LSRNPQTSRRGRPTFKPSPVQRRKVAAAAGGGMSHEEIAIGLGVSRNTLEKHFQAELAEGAYAKRIEMLDAMYKAGKKGNVAAQKAFLAYTPAASAPVLPVEERKPRLGKKEQANADAATAARGTEWDDLIGPGARLQ
jgi:hypothetical protein